MAGRPLKRARLNPRRTLRRDAVMTVEDGTISQPSAGFKLGQFWMVVTLFDPQILRGHPGGGEYNEWNEEQYRWYEGNVLGGVWIRWDSEEDYFLKEKPGVVEFLAAGSGYGPDLLEVAASVAEVPLVLDWQSTKEAAELFKHYGGSVSPNAARHVFRRVPLTKPLDDSSHVVKRVAAAAYNRARNPWSGGRYGSPHLPRYQGDSDYLRQDLGKVKADTQEPRGRALT